MSIIYINNDLILKKDKDSDEISQLEKFDFSKDDIITLSINIKDVITYTLKLPKTLPPEQVKTEAEIQFYENAGLDLQKRFVSFYLIRELPQEDSYLIEAIAIDEDSLHKKFQKIVEKTHFVDFISLSTLAFSEFYNHYKKEPKRDAFVYLDNEQSFVAVYENGEYLYSKTLNSLPPFLKTISLDYDQFVEIISTKGLIKDNYEMDDFLLFSEIDRFFSEYFQAINNRLSYGRNIFYLENIDNVYFYTPFNIEGIKSLKNFWELSGINFEVIEHKDINFLEKLTLLYNANHYKDEINFSIFPRPPKFYKTRTFQLIMVIFLTIAIFGGDFGYRYYTNMQIQKRIKSLTKQNKIKAAKLARLELINKKILQELDEYNKDIDSITKKEQMMDKILKTSLQLVNVPKTSSHFIIFSKLLKNNNLKAFEISKDENNSFEIGVYTKFKNRKFIGLFMNDLSKYHYLNVRTSEISTINDDYYMSIIRFSK